MELISQEQLQISCVSLTLRTSFTNCIQTVTHMIIYFCTGTDCRLHENYNLAKMIQTTFKMHWINLKVLISFSFNFFLFFGSSQITVWVQRKTTKWVKFMPTLWIHLRQLIVAVTVCDQLKWWFRMLGFQCGVGRAFHVGRTRLAPGSVSDYGGSASECVGERKISGASKRRSAGI